MIKLVNHMAGTRRSDIFSTIRSLGYQLLNDPKCKHTLAKVYPHFDIEIQQVKRINFVVRKFLGNQL